jgi:hypothetical protein
MRDAVRRDTVRELAEVIRRNVGDEGIAAAVKTDLRRYVVEIDHPGAIQRDTGLPPGTFPPVDLIADWAVKVGKSRADAFKIARAIFRRGIPAKPYLAKSIKEAIDRVENIFHTAWNRVGL